MKLLDKWRSKAYDETADRSTLQPIWDEYFRLEKGFYEKLLPEKDVVKGTVKELCEKYGIDVFYMTGILDGINDSLVTPNPIEEMDEDTMISLEYDKELLYKNMVAAGADWLYNLEQWNEYFTEDEKKALYKEQKASTTIKKEDKVYPNDPCPCGSGKKFKNCHGRGL